MRAKRCIALLVLLCSGVFVPSVCADTYSTFQTTRYYSTNRRYLVVVNEKKRATLYRNGRRLRRLWSRTLPELPNQLFVTGDGKRVAVVDRYYGNGGSPEARVVVILDEGGDQLASHRLGDVVELGRVLQTISDAHWYRAAHISPDGRTLVIDTQVLRLDPDECRRNVRPGEPDRCWEPVPFQQLRFALATGDLIERTDLASRQSRRLTTWSSYARNDATRHCIAACS